MLYKIKKVQDMAEAVKGEFCRNTIEVKTMILAAMSWSFLFL